MSRFSKKNLIIALQNRADRYLEGNAFEAARGVEQLDGKSVDVCVAYGGWALCQEMLCKLAEVGAVNKTGLEDEFNARASQLALTHRINRGNGTAQLRGSLGTCAAMVAYGEMRLCEELSQGIFDGSFLRFWVAL